MEAPKTFWRFRGLSRDFGALFRGPAGLVGNAIRFLRGFGWLFGKLRWPGRFDRFGRLLRRFCRHYRLGRLFGRFRKIASQLRQAAYRFRMSALRHRTVASQFPKIASRPLMIAAEVRSWDSPLLSSASPIRWPALHFRKDVRSFGKWLKGVDCFDGSAGGSSRCGLRFLACRHVRGGIQFLILSGTFTSKLSNQSCKSDQKNRQRCPDDFQSPNEPPQAH